MHIIGLTGGIASGKSTVSAIFKHMQIPVVDADEISRALTAPGGSALPAICRAFGSGVFASKGVLDRKALGQIVFADEGRRRQLNAILHPMIQAQMERMLASHRIQGEKAVVLDVPLLLETGMQSMANSVWVVACTKEEQLARLMARDGLSEQQALARINAQMSLDEKRKWADVVVDSSRPLDEMEAQIQCLLSKELARLGNGLPQGNP